MLGGIKNKLMYEQLEFFFKGMHLTNPSSNKFYSYKKKSNGNSSLVSFYFHRILCSISVWLNVTFQCEVNHMYKVD